MSRGREYTIRQAQRKKREARKNIKDNDWNDSPSNVGMHAATPTRCSCHMCGNPRNHLGNSHEAKTKQELIADTASTATDCV